uniref:Short chain dehydrogenase n=1 Tax=Anopheles atroparvus TaxID=41427 RepID=A0A182JBX8_ANOAO
SEEAVRAAVKKAVDTFGGIDILINNASAISLTPTEGTDMKRYDLMHNINTRGTFLVSKECLPYLRKSRHAHILNLSPPLNMEPHLFSNHVAYTMAKYGMSMCVLGMAQEYESANISVNALWPRMIIFTAAVEMLRGKESYPYSRTPEIMADAAYAILCRPAGVSTGRSKECLPYLRKSRHAHILNISPPLNMEPHWFSNHVAYTMAKYGMSMCVLGMAREYESANISVNALWPRTMVFTAAVEMLQGKEGYLYSRKPEIMSDAAYAILCRPAGVSTGKFFIDDDVLAEEGVKDFTQYACVPENAHLLTPDVFVNDTKAKL